MSTDAVSPLRQRMIEDMNARKLGRHTQRSHILSCKRFAAFLKRSPDTATAEDIRRFQLHLSQTSVSICSRNRIMTGLRFLFRVTLRRLDLAAEIYHIREPQKVPLVMSPDETRRLLAVADNLKVRMLLGLGYGCGLRRRRGGQAEGQAHRQSAEDHSAGMANVLVSSPRRTRPEMGHRQEPGALVLQQSVARTIRSGVAALAEVCRREFGVPSRIANVERARA